MSDRQSSPDVQRRHIAPERIAGRAEFAAMLRTHVKAAARAGLSLVPSWAAKWRVSEQTVRTWYDETETTGVVGAGDLNALDPGDLLQLLERWVESVRAKMAPTRAASDPRFIAMQASVRAGEIAKAAQIAMADHRCTETEWREIETQLAEAEREMREAKLAARAAAEGGV